MEDYEREIAVLNTYFSGHEVASVKYSKKDMITLGLLDCMFVCIYLPSIIKMWLYIYKFVKSCIDENNNVCDVKYITTYTNLVYH